MYLKVDDQYYLKALNRNDISDKYLSWMNDKEVTATLDIGNRNKNVTRSDLLDYLDSHIDHSYLIGIFTLDGNHIGNYSYKKNPIHKVATLGVVIGDKNYWGKSVVIKTRSVILDWAFTKDGTNKISSGCYSTNIPAILNFKKQKWTQEGILRQHRFVNNKFIDFINYSMLKDEWLNEH